MKLRESRKPPLCVVAHDETKKGRTATQRLPTPAFPPLLVKPQT
jgi:hypothetical protein